MLQKPFGDNAPGHEVNVPIVVFPLAIFPFDFLGVFFAFVLLRFVVQFAIAERVVFDELIANEIHGRFEASVVMALLAPLVVFSFAVNDRVAGKAPQFRDGRKLADVVYLSE